MKRIRSSMQLELEQTKLQLREIELEKAMKKDWKGIKESLKPGNLGKEILRKAGEKLKIFSN